MPADEENEYEVESIVQARIEKQRGKLIWKFCVKWKGYDRSDNTWEPVASFEGSENLLDQFWERIDTGDRDVNNLRLFNVDEQFYPIGPPRRKPKRKIETAKEDKGPSSAGPALSVGRKSRIEKRKRSSPEEEEAPSKKRSRGRADSGKPLAATSKSRKRMSLPASGVDGSRKTSAEGTLSHPGVRSRRRRQQSSSDVADSEDSEDEIMRDYLVEPSGDETSRPVTNSSSNSQPGNLRLAPNQRPSRYQSSKVVPDEPSDSTAAVDIEPSQENLEQLPSSPLFGDEPLPEDVDQDGPSASSSTFIAPASPSFLPSHRVRAANPLVKLIDPEFHGVDGSISTKARLLGRGASGSTQPRNALSSDRPPRQGPNPKAENPPKGLQKNKSSLLTFRKGVLKTVKGKHITETTNGSTNNPMGGAVAENTMGGEIVWGNGQADANAEPDVIPGIPNYKPSATPPEPVPTAEELLQAAGFDNKEAEALPDYEEDALAAVTTSQPMLTAEESLQAVGLDTREAEALPDFEADSSAVATVPEEVSIPEEPTTSILQHSLALAKDNLFPAGLSSATVTNAVSAVWKRSTIFGPLGLATDVPKLVSSGSVISTRPFALTLDPSVSIPIVLSDISIPSTGSPSLDVIVSNCPNGPPGKFYRAQFAHALLDTLRTGGSSARIRPDDDITEEQKHHFDMFCERLNSGEMFVALAGTEVLAFCSSDNALIGQRLNVPPVLFGLVGDVLVTRVVIEKYSAYADAAVHAESIRL